MKTPLHPADYPQLAAIWDAEANECSIEDWRWKPRWKPTWKCTKVPHHRYTTGVYEVVRGYRCPICPGRKICPCPARCNSLWAKHPELRCQWNSKESMKKFTARSNKVVSWRCNVCNNEWDQHIFSRAKTTRGCPFCTGSRVAPNTSVAATHPHLMDEWIEELNGPATKVWAGSNTEYWWRCRVINHHIWPCRLVDRTRAVKPSGCPYCHSDRVCPVDGCNSLGAKFPQLRAEWADTNPDIMTVMPGSGTPFEWICPLHPGKTYTAVAHNRTKAKPTGCPRCCYKSEDCARDIFESLLPGYRFDKVRPPFLKSLELDGFNADLRLAFEYDGPQHSQYKPFFHRTEGSLRAQQARDRLKDKLCSDNDVYLIRVPGTIYTCADPNAMQTFIAKRLHWWQNMSDILNRLPEVWGIGVGHPEQPIPVDSNEESAHSASGGLNYEYWSVEDRNLYLDVIIARRRLELSKATDLDSE